VCDLQRDQEREAAVDELRGEEQPHHDGEVRELEHVGERHPGARLTLSPAAGDTSWNEHDQPDERQRAEPRRREERVADAEVRGDVAADRRADRDAQQLSRLHHADRRRAPCPWAPRWWPAPSPSA
jgi:hypothetical protein